MQSHEMVDWDGVEVILVFKVAEFRSARPPYVIYQLGRPLARAS
jgi:hypothetical protein